MPTSTGSLKHTALDQHPEMCVHQTSPLNVGAPLELIRQSFITQQEYFFVRNHGAVPHVNVQRYRLAVTGQVQVPLTLSLDELRAHFPASTVVATLQCAGHRRNELAAVQPIPGEIPWGQRRSAMRSGKGSHCARCYWRPASGQRCGTCLFSAWTLFKKAVSSLHLVARFPSRRR